MKNHFLFFIVFLTIHSCVTDNSVEKPKACFDYTKTFEPLTGKTITFSNCSENSNTYSWDFGDGNVSSEISPKHIYKSNGLYHVILKSYDNNEVDSCTQTITIEDILYFKDTILDTRLYETNPAFSIDVDADNRADFVIKQINTGGSTGHWENTEISSFNSYEISIDSTVGTHWEYNPYPDKLYSYYSVVCPKIYKKGGMIKSSDSFSNEVLFFANYDDHYYHSSASYYNNWSGDDDRFMGYRKVYGNTTTLGWIKLKVLDYSKIQLFYCKMPQVSDELKIE